MSVEKFEDFRLTVKERALELINKKMLEKIESLNKLLSENSLFNTKKRTIENSYHETIQNILVLVKSEVVELIETCNAIKLFIHLNIPKIEDGNNFGVSVQEDIVQELGRGEESGFSILESASKYFTSRARLVSKQKKEKNRDNVDYQLAIDNLDFKQFQQIKLCVMDLRNNYSVLFDTISKNLDKLLNPRSQNTSSMY